MKKLILLPALFISGFIYAQIRKMCFVTLSFHRMARHVTRRSVARWVHWAAISAPSLSTPPAWEIIRPGNCFHTGYFMHHNKVDYRESKSKNSQNGFALGPIGLVYGMQTNATTSHAVSFAVTQTANYNNIVNYNGLNNLSSYSEQWAEQLAKSGLSIDEALNTPAFAYGTAPALYTYLVDTFRVNGAVQVRGLPENILDAGQALRQANEVETSGAQYEVALGYAMNKNDKFQWGVTLGIPIMDYHSTTTFHESDTSANASNGFGSFTYTDDYTTNGAGVNLKLGVIVKPT
jgi:hypothetical protein